MPRQTDPSDERGVELLPQASVKAIRLATNLGITTMGRVLLMTLFVVLSCSAFGQSPGGISTNLQLWLPAENYAGGAAWTDASGNGRNATKTGSVGNTTLYNFHNVPTGFTTANYFSVAHHTNLNTNSGAISVIAVGLSGNGTYAPFVSKTADQTWPNGWVMATSDPMSHLGFTTGNWDGTGTTNVAKQTGVPTTTPYIASGFGNGASTNQVSVCYNGTTVATNSSTKTSSNVPLRVGFDGDAYGFNGGNIAEVIMYNANLSAGDRQRVWSYLAVKYGITLNNGGTNYVNSSGTVVWNITTNSGYNNDIFGIGRDNTSSLHQRQGTSINSGQQPVIAHGTTLVNLNSAGADLSTNNSFLIAGADNGASTFDTWLSGFDDMNSRITRIWRVQESGTIGTVTVAWPSSDASIQLLVSNNATFDGADNAYPTTAITINGTAYRQASVDLSNGQYFTFGSIVASPGGYWNNLALWLTTDRAGVAPGSNATSWADVSKTGNPVESVGTRTLQQPDAAHNFQPYFTSFSSTSYFKDVNSSIAPQNTLQATELTMFAVARINSATADGRIMGIDDNDPNANDPGLSVFDAAARFHRVSTSTINLSSTNLAQVGRTSVFSAYTSGTTAGVGVDGVYNTQAITAGGGMRGDILTVGYGTTTTAGALPGDLQEVIWYKRTLSATEIKQVESYLALKHGLTLGPTGNNTATYNYLNSIGTVVWNRATHSGFNNNITGIGRDDASSLDQKQSTNVNGAGCVTLSLGNIATGNAVNANTFNQDRSFLIVGNDNGAHNAVFNDPACYNQLPAGVQGRIQRRWKVQRTNFTQTITLAFDQSALVGHLPVSNLRLMIDDDGTDWTNATVISGATSAGGRVVFTGVDLSAGTYFTLGSANLNSTPLPVELISFEGRIVQEGNQLTWRTATETNNDHFELERSEDGATFGWLADIAAVGNSQQVTSYVFVDQLPQNGLNYYRLMQVDEDGTFTYSPVVVLNNSRKDKDDCLVRTLESEGLYMLHCAASDRTTLQLISPAGQPIHTAVFGGSAMLEVDLRRYASGIYFARITDGTTVKTYKLLRP